MADGWRNGTYHSWKIFVANATNELVAFLDKYSEVHETVGVYTRDPENFEFGSHAVVLKNITPENLQELKKTLIELIGSYRTGLHSSLVNSKGELEASYDNINFSSWISGHKDSAFQFMALAKKLGIGEIIPAKDLNDELSQKFEKFSLTNFVFNQGVIPAIMQQAVKKHNISLS